MQAGFGILEAGTVRFKNRFNILVKVRPFLSRKHLTVVCQNICDTCVSALTFYLFGYGFAYGEDQGGFIGASDFALTETSGNGYHLWVFQVSIFSCRS